MLPVRGDQLPLVRIEDEDREWLARASAWILIAAAGWFFIGGLVIAKLIRGNLLASLIGTFVNNFLTLVPISAMQGRIVWASVFLCAPDVSPSFSISVYRVFSWL